MSDEDLNETLERAQKLARRGEDEAAKAVYLAALRIDPTHFTALNDLAALLCASGHRSAARRAYAQAIAHHPGNAVARVNLGNLIYEEGDHAAAEQMFRAALAIDDEFYPAHQGLALILGERNEDSEAHRRKGFVGHAVVAQRFRGEPPGVPLLLLVSAKLGNMATRRWIDDRQYAVTEIFVEFFEPSAPLPPHRMIVNAIGDADLCAADLLCAEVLLARTKCPVLNPPARVRATGRVENARRLDEISGVVAPKTALRSREDILMAENLAFPLLLRAPGFHTGRHFMLVERRENLPDALAALPGERLLTIDYLDARGPDGFARKYRVLFVNGEIYPLHLAISADWMVHYFSAAMAENAAFRDEERRFLENMPEVLGARAMAALRAIEKELGLDYAGVDFALARDGALLLFEANATMNVFPPDPAPMWDYRRAPVEAVLHAARRMVSARL